MKHRLIIKCLNDAQAECNCGKWFISCTGERKRKDIEKEYKKHLLYISGNLIKQIIS